MTCQCCGKSYQGKKQSKYCSRECSTKQNNANKKLLKKEILKQLDMSAMEKSKEKRLIKLRQERYCTL
jgi:hypothetical protein